MTDGCVHIIYFEKCVITVNTFALVAGKEPNERNNVRITVFVVLYYAK